MADYKYRVRRLDENGDIVMSGQAWLYDLEAIAQTIKTRLYLFSGEYWRDASDGTPWIDRILTKNNNANTLQAKIAILRRRILDTDGVRSILTWNADFDFATRKLSIQTTVLTEFGTTNINVSQ